MPVILAGDFNSRPDDPVISLLERHFVRPPKRGPRLTFPADAPQREIDYIIYRPDSACSVRAYSVHAERVISDHRPLVMELDFR